MIPGQIIESYQGKFAKVIRLTEGGHTHLSAWVKTPELAEAEAASVSFLNDFGISQVVKGGAGVEPEAEATKADKPAKAPKAE